MTRALVWMAVVAPAWAGGFEELSPEQRATLGNGKQVVVTEEVEGNAWPRVTVYEFTQVSPRQVTAVFFDYAAAKDYIPNVMKSEISGQRSARETDVDYTLDVPILPDEHYTARNTLMALPGGYAVKWKMLRARQTKASEGEFRALAERGGAVVRYVCLTTPSSGMAGLLRWKAVEQIKETVGAICREAERMRSEEPAVLDAKVRALDAALAPTS